MVSMAFPCAVAFTRARPGDPVSLSPFDPFARPERNGTPSRWPLAPAPRWRRRHRPSRLPRLPLWSAP